MNGRREAAAQRKRPTSETPQTASAYANVDFPAPPHPSIATRRVGVGLWRALISRPTDDPATGCGHHRKASPELYMMSDFVITADVFRNQPVLTGHRARAFQDHGIRLRILNGRSMTRVAQRVASVMSRRPSRWYAPMARLRSAAMTRGPERVRAVESSSR